MGSFTALRRFARPKSPAEYCELCGAALPGQHDHLLEPGSRQLFCSCAPCAILFSAQRGQRLLRVPQRVSLLTNFQLSDAVWDALHLPINLAFFVRSSPADRVLAYYPSPAGATESLLSLDAWRALEDENSILQEFEADVEALLVNRVPPSSEYYRAPIDECYRLVGLIRAQWRGLSGGSEVWDEIRQFFDELLLKATALGGTQHD
jgi:hypothetical protein